MEVDRDADAAGLRVAFVADTQLHADFVSGAVQLAATDGAQILASAGATHVELGDLADPSIVRRLPSGPVLVMCGHGERAMSAASLLQAAGRQDASVLAGGPQEWASATGTALVSGAGAAP